MDLSQIDFSHLDRPEILALLFHPRPEWGSGLRREGVYDVMIPVEDYVSIGARFHMADPAGVNLFFFHGNGEIVADYDDLGPFYNRMGLNFLAADYRGYGRSTGHPSITAMMRDGHVIFDFVRTWLAEKGYGGPLLPMGRSLGSASAIELASCYPQETAGLIVESGFAWTGPLLELLGTDLGEIGYAEEQGLGNLDKIRTVANPTLVIHAEQDMLLPFRNGQALFEASGAADKTLLRVPGAGHNDILAVGFEDYMQAVGELAGKVSG